MAQLLFFDQEHKYTVDNEEYPSVSELCRFLSREVYGEIAQFRLDNAAERGTAVHKACEALDKYGKIEVTEDILPYIKAYVDFRKNNEVEWEKIEWATYHPTLKYAGTLDRVGVINGKRVIVDIKSSYKVQKTLAVAQLNLYRMMLEANGEKVDELYILHLTKDGKWKLIQFDVGDDVPKALITLHELTKKKKRKKKSDKEED